MVSQGTAQPFVLVIYIINMNGVDVAYPATSYDSRYVASLSYTLFAHSTHASVEVRSLLSLSNLYWIGSFFSLVVRCILNRLNCFSCRSSRGSCCHVSGLTDFLDNFECTLKHYCLK